MRSLCHVTDDQLENRTFRKLFSNWEIIVRKIGDTAAEGNETLWKYFRFERFLSTLAESRLYFASANQFIDPFEGAVAVQLNVPPPDPRYAEMESVEHAFFQLKRLTKISCWHRADYESDAMWKLYAGEHKGCRLAVKRENAAVSARFGI